jgi:tetratricopeptide (TPR) repeat protein
MLLIFSEVYIHQMRYFIILLLTTTLLYSCSNDEKKSDNKHKNPLEFLSNEIVNQPDDYTLYARRAAIYLEQGKLDPAFRDLNKAISINPNNAELYILLSDVYFILGNKENSITSLNKAVSLEPKNPVPLIKLSELYLLMSDYEKVHFFSSRALLLDVNLAKPYYHKGVAFLETSDTANAILNLKIASNIDTANFDANMQLGAIYYNESDSISEIYLKKAIKNRPTAPSALYYLGMLYQENSEFDKALDIYTQLFNNAKSGKRAYFNSGYIYLVELQQFDLAEEMFRQAIDIDPAFIEALCNLGRTYEAKDELDLASEYYNRTLEVLPNYPLAIQGLNRLDYK